MAWDKKPSAFAQSVSKEHNRRVVRAALYTWRQVTAQSPVDTGRFRANWIVTPDRPSTETTENTTVRLPVFPRNKLVFWIVNNLPYARRLNEGWSTQASPGWVDAIVISAKRKLDRGAI